MPAKKKPAAKKSATKKSTARKSTAKPAARSSKSSVSVSSDSQFLQARFTEQTIYWVIIGVAVLALATWVLSLQTQLDEMYNQIELTSQSSYVPAPQE